MKLMKKMLVTAMVLSIAQTSMAYTGQIRMNGFTSEAEAINGAKTAVEEMQQGQKFSANHLGNCQVPPMSDVEVGDIQINKYFKSVGNGFAPTFEAQISYNYDCQDVALP